MATATTQKNKVLHFMLWRAGKSVNWDCTEQELADEVGCSHQAVHYWVKKSGWKLLEGHRRGHGVGVAGRLAVDTLMGNTYLQNRD